MLWNNLSFAFLLQVVWCLIPFTQTIDKKQNRESLGFHGTVGGQSSESVNILFAAPAGQSLNYPEKSSTGVAPRDVWMKAYHRAKKDGNIPALKPSKIVDGIAVYTPGQNPCNFGSTECFRSSDILHASPGVSALSFDDGPHSTSDQLLQFLQSKSLKATHFIIGSEIQRNLQSFQNLDNAKHHFAVHTYSHPMMTSLDDEKVIGEIGWGMQAIHDNTKQKVIPKYWRPPYGDIDDRVRAIAKHVFGLETILWDQDPKDWCLSDQNPGASACATGRGPQTLNDLETKYKSYANENIKKGMLSLHHETSVRPIQAYKKLYSELKSKGWAIKNIPDMLNKPWYQA